MRNPGNCPSINGRIGTCAEEGLECPLVPELSRAQSVSNRTRRKRRVAVDLPITVEVQNALGLYLYLRTQGRKGRSC